MEMTFSNLCDSCTNIGCEFQSGIVRTKCAFYMPPQLEPNNCGNYVVQKPTTMNDLGVDCISRTELLKAMDTWDKFGYTARYGLERLDKDDKDFVPYVKYEDMVNCVKGMPSVTPQEPQDFKWCTDCREHDQEKHCCHRWSKVIRDTIEEMKQESRWIPVSERLPEEKINPITEDYSEYQCTVRFGNLYDVRSYKYGEGHWRLGAGIVDDYVIAWRELPEPYKEGINEISNVHTR